MPTMRKTFFYLIIPAALALAGCASNKGSANPLAGFVESISPPTPGEAARSAFDIYDADVRRRSISLIAASPFGHEPPYVRMYRLLADDPDPTVRAATLQALGLHGGTQDVDVLLRGLEDQVTFVRWEAAKALQKVHGEKAIKPLIDAVLEDEDVDVRIAAAHALGQYRQPAVFTALVSALGDNDFGVVAASHGSLTTLTGADLSRDATAWLNWAEQNQGQVFVNARPYTYQPWVAPPGWMEKVQFWKDREPVAPRRPAGLEASAEESTGVDEG